MKHVIEHPLGEDVAHTVVERAFDEYKTRYASYHPSLTWKSKEAADVGFTAKGVSLRGRIALRPGAIDVELDVPLLLRVFQKRAMEVIDREVRRWIERARAGEV
ncbi:MAG TPA: polyhydroxyalkanoic acid system family protein [Minicystis sp.]|nr:polyhydroxyalkanoic acid system family protein [Minicystis sp.]